MSLGLVNLFGLGDDMATMSADSVLSLIWDISNKLRLAYSIPLVGTGRAGFIKEYTPAFSGSGIQFVRSNSRPSNSVSAQVVIKKIEEFNGKSMNETVTNELISVFQSLENQKVFAVSTSSPQATSTSNEETITASGAGSVSATQSASSSTSGGYLPNPFKKRSKKKKKRQAIEMPEVRRSNNSLLIIASVGIVFALAFGVVAGNRE